MKTIRRGDKGTDVSAWQRVLLAGPRPAKWVHAMTGPREWRADWPWPIAADGDFGAHTEAATEAWQCERGLVADGVVGARTWTAAGKTVRPAPPSPTGTGIPFIATPNQSIGRKARVRVLVVHTMEMSEVERAARNCATYFANPKAKASAHYCVDASSVFQCVRDEDTAWHAGAANDFSIGIEHAGFAKQTTSEWADDYSMGMLRRSAALSAQLCVRFGIPARRLTPAQLKAGEAGLCGHFDVTTAFANGKGHWDPGPNFPWDFFITEIAAGVRKLTEATTPVAAADV